MVAQPNLSLNQFNQQPILGQQAFEGPNALVSIQAVVSATGSPSLYPGQAVKFDTTITGTPSGLPQIVAAAGTAYADGYILSDVKNAAPLTSGAVVVIVLQGILWMLAESTVTIGDILQDGADAGGVATFATTNYYPRGVALDYGTVGQLIRCNMTPFTIKAAAAPVHA